MNCAKLSLFIFNLIFVILGLVVIVSGIFVFTSKENDFEIILTDSSLPFFSVGTLTIILGVIIFIVAFAGCCGAIKEHKCLLATFVILLIIILLVEFAVVILGFFYQRKADEFISDAIKEGMKQYQEEDKPTYKEAWDFIQQNNTCCGVDNATDWQEYGGFTNSMVPTSCCGNGTSICTLSNAFGNSCQEALLASNATENSLLFAGISAIVIVLAEIFGILFACCVLRSAGKEKGNYT